MTASPVDSGQSELELTAWSKLLEADETAKQNSGNGKCFRNKLRKIM